MSDAGIQVNPENMLTVPAVRSSIAVISDTIATLPLNVLQETDDGPQVAKNHAVQRLLHTAPNSEMTTKDWLRLVCGHFLRYGDHFSVIERNQRDEPRAIWPLNPEQMSVARRDSKRVYTYRLRDGGRTEEYLAQDIIHIMWMPDADGLASLHPATILAGPIGLALALEKFGAKFFANDARPGMVLELAGNPTGDAIERAREKVERGFKGLGSAHQVMAMGVGDKLHMVGVEPEHAQFLESRRHQTEEIARAYRVPPPMLQDLSRATFSNSEQADLHFAKHTIRPWLEIIEAQLTLKLFKRSNYSAVFNIDGLVRGDLKTRMEALSKAVQNALMTPNEARAKLKLPRKDGGDELFLQQNMAGLDQINDLTGGGNGGNDDGE